MGRLVKWLVVLMLIGGLLYGASYAGARFRVGEIMGPEPPEMGRREIRLGYDSVPGTPGKRLVWTFSWSPTPWTGRRPVQIWVSPTGNLLRIWPPNLESLIEQHYRSKEEI